MLNLLKLPEASAITNLDDPNNINILRQVIQRKPFLLNIYKDFYREMLEKVRTVPQDGKLVELGSGAGFLKTLAPKVVTSDFLPYSGIDMVFSALDMPFEDSSISAVLMFDVFHHLKDSKQFFEEMKRCLKNGGKVVMIEPANTIWSRFIYTNYHHEPFEVDGEWGFAEGGPLTGANMAIPYIVFFRDSKVFAKEFPELKVCSIRIHTPLRYLLSGGLSLRQLLPSFSYPVIRLLEWLLTPLNQYLGMFMTIELEKKSLSTESII